MGHFNARQIWDEVFDGKVLNAVERSRYERNRLIDDKVSVDLEQRPMALYLEPSLGSVNGHQLTLAMCYIKELEKQGYSALVVHSLRHSLEKDSGWTPFFLVTHSAMPSRTINSNDELEKIRQYFAYEFRAAIEQYRPRFCVFATIRFTNIVAAVDALVSCSIRHVIFGVMEAETVPDCDNTEVVRSAFIQAAENLQVQGISHLVFAETKHVSDFLLGCGFRKSDVKVFPYVAASMITEFDPAESRPVDKIHIGYLGGSRPVRHPELIAELITSELIPESICLSVQLDLKYIKSKCGQELCDSILAFEKMGRIKLYPPNLSHQDYRSLFCSLDFVVMPYGERYEQIGSGVFLEAIYAGAIPICAAGSKIHELYQSLGGEPPSFCSLSVTAIAGAIHDAVSRFSDLKSSTDKIKENWNLHPSSAEQWRTTISEWLPTTQER